MVDIRSLTTGLFITSCMIVFGLWINSLANSSVTEINFIPSRAVVETGEVSAARTVAAEPSKVANELINSEPTVFSNRSYTWTEPKTSEIDDMRALISTELGEYSSGYLNTIGLRQIILVDDIRNRANQPVLGFSDPLAGDIYLNTVELEGEYSRSVVAEQTVHHEIAHFLAYASYGYWFDRDSGWQELDQNYAYGDITNAEKEYFPRDGFVSRYSMNSPGEDFAEIYSLIYTEYFRDTLKKEAGRSELLESKTQFVYETISTIDRGQCLESYQALDAACD